ncbi:hypothetical protein GCM10017771_23260 [Streptomyces capitiformicae]|uniref:Uncharacterized protein n=1 Tax=Streptomyces capitiformicae TaxID=2014920 RepID=A0A919GKX6_9ACTN|nr:hypothetical protein GCM10017771_23260 [Streptomyces capitiformicae]
MTCARCWQPITPDEVHDMFVPDSGSVAKPAVYFHAWPCPEPPARTAPPPVPEGL